MTAQINAKPLAGFDQPIEMLMDCHRRIEHFLAVLQRVAVHAGQRPPDAEARRAVRSAEEYFERAAPKHTADEEESLFPRLLQSPSPPSEVLRVMTDLEHDHREAERLHERVKQAMDSWLASERRLSHDTAAALGSDLDALSTLYARHIAAEEQQLFPAAAATLNADQLRSVGEEMRRRRQT